MKLARTNIFLLSVFIVLSFLLGACSSTKLVQRWNDPEYKGPKLKKILVIGIIKKDVLRRSFEEDFSSLITNSDRTGIASYTLLPSLKDADSKQDVLAAVKKTGADGVLVVTLVKVTKERQDVAPSVDYHPVNSYDMHGYYGASYTRVYRPGHTVTNTIVSLEVKMFNAASEKMIWAGNTESFNAASSSVIINELEKLVISDMQSSGIVK